ncbi:MAG: tRNA preQ1(34) S-adenosylmethionine ribosyltransferase-isomerase QueA [Chloroflexota bacterium]|nr:MAG: tRNA preQ1(34) S-adenosylmethionine ribosyltransferase-isomerase QueA [Chloroflexota bacterium]
MRTDDFDYLLPPERIAQTPIEPRDASRMLVLHRSHDTWEHRRFVDLEEYLRPGDLLVCNQSRVIPARLIGRREGTTGRVEVLLLRRTADGLWETLVKPGRKARPGTRVIFERATLPDLDQGAARELVGDVLDRTSAGGRLIRFNDEGLLERAGDMPLPPYIHEPLRDGERYQTIYARIKGSAAAPTAGLHFTASLMDRLQRKGIGLTYVTLHIGLDTFRPVHEEDPRTHEIHTEYVEIDAEAAGQIGATRRAGGRIVAVGTTSVRALETGAQAARASGEHAVVAPHIGPTDLYILPGHRFLATDALVTNFHLPRSTLLMLVSAFAGRDLVLRTYNEAIREGYRFYSFGDAMLIL